MNLALKVPKLLNREKESVLECYRYIILQTKTSFKFERAEGPFSKAKRRENEPFLLEDEKFPKLSSATVVLLNTSKETK